MGVIICYLLVVTIAICLTSVESALQGVATFYDPPYVPSACFGYQDQGNFIAGVGDELWDNGAACGKHVHVTCIGTTNPNVPHPCSGETTMVKIVDHNPGAATIINLSATAFAIIADPNAGSVDVNVHIIP